MALAYGHCDTETAGIVLGLAAGLSHTLEVCKFSRTMFPFMVVFFIEFVFRVCEV